MAKESLSRYALAPWGMQPNTSLAAHFPRFPWADFHSCLYAAYYTISGVLAAFYSHPCQKIISTAANPSRTIQPPIFFPFTIKTFYRSSFLFTIISQPMFSSPCSSILSLSTSSTPPPSHRISLPCIPCHPLNHPTQRPPFPSEP